MKKAKQKVLCGADVIARDGFELQGKCGLITNRTGALRDLSSTVDMLKEKSRPAEKERYAPPEKQSVRDQLRRLQAEGRQTKPKHRSHDRER